MPLEMPCQHPGPWVLLQSVGSSPQLKQGDQGRRACNALGVVGQGPVSHSCPLLGMLGVALTPAHWETLGKTPAHQQSPCEEETRDGSRVPQPHDTHKHARLSPEQPSFTGFI